MSSTNTQPLPPAPSKRPQPKVVAATLASAIVTVVFIVLRDAAGYDASQELTGATVVLATALAGYFKRN